LEQLSEASAAAAARLTSRFRAILTRDGGFNPPGRGTLEALVLCQVWDSEGKPWGACRATRDAKASLHCAEAAVSDLLGAARRRLVESGPFTESIMHGDRALDVSWLPLRGPGGNLAGVACLAFDAEVARRTHLELSRRLEFETLITGLSTHFIGLGAQDIDEGIDQAMRAVGEFCDVDRAYLFQFSDDRTAMNNTHEWCAPGIEPQLERLQDLPLEAFPWWTDHIRRRQVIHVPRVNDLPDAAATEKQILLEQQIRSVVAVPTLYERTVVGFLGFDSVHSEKTWAVEDIALLKIVGEMLVSALERKRADEERRSLEAQLVQARSLENVAKLAGGVAHDFNNLLAIILNYGALLRREVDDPKLEEWLAELVRSAKQASHLTRQLLIVGRRGVIDPLVVELHELLRGLEDLLRRTLGESVQLKLELDPSAGLVKIGIPQLEQVVVNLALNARAAMPRGGEVVISVTGVLLDGKDAARRIDVVPGQYTRLSVRDSGIGMTPEVAARALEPFFTTRGSAGTGLGLSTVHSIVKQAGGHLLLESAEGRGTAVSLFFPAVNGVAPPAVSDATASPVMAGRGETILVVEDTTALRQIVCQMLREAGYRVLGAADPVEALRTCEQTNGAIDLIVSDVIMPKMSGRALAEAVRERYGISRVIFISGYEDEVLANHGVLREGVRLLQKPFEEGDLLRFVRAGLDES
jgi:signal transduction histidine kinase/ActR/RegA family two-component response regulator